MVASPGVPYPGNATRSQYPNGIALLSLLWVILGILYFHV
jgi:hypothetical protein